MKIAVVGLGAIGGLLAARLAGAGVDVSALVRSATLDAVRERGLRIDAAGGSTTTPIKVGDDAHELGPQDLVILALKAPALAAAAVSLQPLLGEQTIVMPAMNGVPWWFLQTDSGDAAPLESVDPGGRIAALLPLRRVLGCVVHLSASSPAPGVVRHHVGDRLIVGEPAGGGSARVDAVCATLASAGFRAEASTDLRSALWYKLWGNMTINPVSALTGAETDRILDDPLLREFVLRTMAEAKKVGDRVGCPIDESGEDRLDVTRELGAFRTSMLQDVAAGRPIELDALVGAVHEIARRVGVATPNIDALFGLTRLMARGQGLYPPSEPVNDSDMPARPAEKRPLGRF